MSVLECVDQDFNDTLSSNDKVVVKYFANWCGSCKLFSPKYKRLSNDERFSGITFLDVNHNILYIHFTFLYKIDQQKM